MQVPFWVVFEQRGDTPKRLTVLVPVLSVLAALFFGAIFLFATGYSPFDTYINMVSDGFASSRGITDTLALSTVLICTGIAAAFAFQMNIYNIGGEGQLYLGMIGGAWAGITLGDHLPSLIMVPLVLMFGAIGGALWIFVPAFVRARLGTSEIVSTLLLTYVASSLVEYVIYTPDSYFRNPNTAFPQGRLISASAKLQSFGDSRLYPTIFVAIIIAVALYWVVKRTEFGYRINVIADSSKAAHYAGINSKRTTISVMLISGALAGLGGAMLIVGPYGKIEPSVVNLGYGYAGIVIAALARNNLAAIVVSGILFSGLRVGGEKLQISTDTPIHIGVMLQGAILLFALGGEAFRRYKIQFVRVQAVVT
jgi:simple sugar transport system permease protein